MVLQVTFIEEILVGFVRYCCNNYMSSKLKAFRNLVGHAFLG